MSVAEFEGNIISKGEVFSFVRLFFSKNSDD